jgi:uncharacterized membrane protein YoaK (UPF0700 family)
MRRLTTLGLTFIAGFVDTMTFIGVHGLFAAHVTGNFVVFGAALAKGVQPQDYLKLIAFPVFVGGVMAGSMICSISKQRIEWIILIQGMLFALVALASYLSLNTISLSALGLILVAAMGLQNSIHRYISGPMTTVMTGTVMNWSTGLAERLFRLPMRARISSDTKPITGSLMLSFVSGCTLATFASQSFGLTSAIIPAILLVLLAIYETPNKEGSPTI